MVFKNSLGSKVRATRATLKHLGNLRPRIKRLVDTVFFLTLLDFNKKTEIKKSKPFLRIDYGIANLIAEYSVFKRTHSELNLDPSFLDDYEAKILKQ